MVFRGDPRTRDLVMGIHMIIVIYRLLRWSINQLLELLDHPFVIPHSPSYAMSSTDQDQALENTVARVEQLEECLTVKDRNGLPKLGGWQEEADRIEHRIDMLNVEIRKLLKFKKKHMARLTSVELECSTISDELDQREEEYKCDDAVTHERFKLIEARLNALEDYHDSWSRRPSSIRRYK
jgi:hypothetical protein